MSYRKTDWWNLADEDDGEPGEQKPLTATYEARCMMCSRIAGEFRLTATQARNHVLVGLPACHACGGFVLLDVMADGVGGHLKRRVA